MRKYVYDNAIVYITEPNEQQLSNIRLATERFAKQLVKKGLMHNDERQGNQTISRHRANAGEGNRRTKRKDRTN